MTANRVFSRITCHLSVLLLLACFNGAAVAQGDLTFWLKVERVDQAGPTSRMLSGTVAELPVSILVDSATKVKDPSGRALGLEAIIAGKTLRVTAEWRSDHFAASEAAVNSPEEVVLTGILESVSGNRIRVANTVMDLAEGVSAPADQGGLVEVRGRFGPDGTLTALSVERKAALQLFGVVETAERTGEHEISLQVGSRTVRVSDLDTAIILDDAPLDPNELKAGQFVDIWGELEGNAIVAGKIQVSNPRAVSARGTIATFDARSVSVNLTEGTLGVRTDNETRLSGGTLASNARVGVAATLQPDGSLLASRILVGTAADKTPRPGVVQGTVLSVGASSLVITNNVVIKVDSATVFATKGAPMTFSDIKVGDLVTVTGTPQSDKSILAARIVITPPALLRIRGTVTAVGSSSFTVGTDQVFINSQTVFVAKTGSLTFASLKVGDQVSATVTRQANGSLLATKVDIIPAAPVLVTIRGNVASITTAGSFFTVGSDKIVVNAQTVIATKATAFSFADLKVGYQVTIVGARQADGSVLATRIDVIVPAPVTTTVRGTIASIGTDFITVGTQKVVVNSQTVIVTKTATLTFANLKLGDQVMAAGTVQSDGSVLATKIQVTPPPVVPTTIRGVITKINGSTSFVVASTTVTVDSKTVFAAQGQTVTFSDLKVGTSVAVTGTKQSDGSILAAKVEITM